MAPERSYWTTRNLFAARYLGCHLPETAAWDQVDDSALRQVRAEVERLWEQDRETGSTAAFVRSVLRSLDVRLDAEASATGPQHQSGYAVLASGEADDSSDNAYPPVVTVVEGTLGDGALHPPDGGEQEQTAAAVYHLHYALQESIADWGVLTDGQRWRLYHHSTSHDCRSYYEVDLPALLADDDHEAFKYFHRFFRRAAFEAGPNGDGFLDTVYADSQSFAREMGADLQENCYDAVVQLATGFLDHPDNDLDADDLDRVFAGARACLYRLLFALYANAEGNGPFGGRNRPAGRLHRLAREVAAELDRPGSVYDRQQTTLWSRLASLFATFDGACGHDPIPETVDTDVDSLRGTHVVGDTHLARVIDLLARCADESGEKRFIEYDSLDVHRIGSIHEGLLACRLEVAETPLTLEDGAYVPAADNGDTVVEADGVYLARDDGERRAAGAYYTPPSVVEYVVAHALGPLVEEIRAESLDSGTTDGNVDPDAFAAEVLELQVLDPAMGCGRFLTSVVEYLAKAIVDGYARQSVRDGAATMHPDRAIDWARRQVTRRCINGVDLDPLAVELAKGTLRLHAGGIDRHPQLDHQLQVGNALIGCDSAGIDTVAERVGAAEASTAPGPGGSGSRVVEPRRRPRLARIDGVEIGEDRGSVEQSKRRLAALANVYTAERFGVVQIPDDAFEQLAAAVDDDARWNAIATTAWFEDAQQLAADERFVHWPLAFPGVFIDGPGESDKRAGFDAIVGNPPWGIETDERRKAYLQAAYDLHTNKPDRYRFFIERGLALADRIGMVTPNTWLVMGSGRRLRRHVIEHGALGRASIVPGDAFEGVDANMVTFQLDRRGESDAIDVWELQAAEEPAHRRSIAYADIDRETYAIELHVGGRARAIAARMEDHATSLDTIADATTGYQLYHTSIHAPAVIDAEPYHADHLATDDHVPELRGRSLSPFHVDPEPDGYVDASAEFYRVPARRFRAAPRVLVREVTGTDGIVAAHTDRTAFVPKSIISVVPADADHPPAYLAALLNSDALAFYHLVAGEKSAQALFPRLSVASLNRLPVAPGDGPVPTDLVDHVLADRVVDEEFGTEIRGLAERAPTVASFVAELADEIAALNGQQADGSPDLFDYLEDDVGGSTVRDHDACRRANGVDETPLAQTATDRPNLHLDAVHVEHESSTVRVSGVARYKLESGTAPDADRWGYTTTQPSPAIEFGDLEHLEGELIATFIDAVVNDTDAGTAGFRPEATKTNSLLDRIEAIHLPDPAAARPAFERYREHARRHSELADRSNCAMALVNAIVFELYGLTPADREIVRRTLERE